MNQRIDRIDVREYLAKHKATAEFNDEGPFSKLQDRFYQKEFAGKTPSPCWWVID